MKRTAQQLAKLHERKLRADDQARQAHDALCLALLACHEHEGASVREMAAAIGRGSTTVQTWLRQAEQLRAAR